MLKNINFKSLIIGVIIGGVLFTAIPSMASSTKSIDVFYDNIKLKVNGKIIKTDQEPFVMNGRTFVPARFVAEPLGATVKFNETDNTVEIESKIVSPSAITNTPTITNSSTMPNIDTKAPNITINGGN